MECQWWYDYLFTEDITLYDKWAEAVNVTWDANGGRWNNAFWLGSDSLQATAFTSALKKDQLLKPQMNFSEPVRNDYAFDGWYFDEQCTIVLRV